MVVVGGEDDEDFGGHFGYIVIMELIDRKSIEDMRFAFYSVFGGEGTTLYLNLKAWRGSGWGEVEHDDIKQA